jgi:hypothetical protein
MRDLIPNMRRPGDAQRAYDELRDRGTKLLTVAVEW